MELLRLAGILGRFRLCLGQEFINIVFRDDIVGNLVVLGYGFTSADLFSSLYTARFAPSRSAIAVQMVGPPALMSLRVSTSPSTPMHLTVLSRPCSFSA